MTTTSKSMKKCPLPLLLLLQLVLAVPAESPKRGLLAERERQTRSGYAQIANGKTAEPNEILPHHVGVYFVDWTSGEFDHICGGSLISTKLVVSAAHCFYDEDQRRVNEARRYVVAAGKRNRSYYESEDTQQNSQVQRIYVPDGYGGDENMQKHDIAILLLWEQFNDTRTVMPIRIDFNESHILKSGQMGKVMGWGANATGFPNEELQEINLPYIDRNFCQQNAPNNFGRLITSDKICAGYTNGSSTCHGDSGGGLSVQIDRRWYLRGVLSVGDVIKEGNQTLCNRYYYTAFTNVANYTTWIKSVMNDASKDSKCPDSSRQEDLPRNRSNRLDGYWILTVLVIGLLMPVII